MSVPLSVLIPVRNEAANIRACLASARFADQIFVVDSGSGDGTREIAAELGAAVIDFRWDGKFPKKKNWALEHLPWRNEWVFILDADERITPELAAEIGQVLSAPDCDGYYVNRRFWFLDGWLRHCGYYPSWNLRLFRHRLGRYERLSEEPEAGAGDNEIHEHVALRGRAGRLRHEMDHYAFPDLTTWVEKHNRYSTWEAHLLVRGAGAAADAPALVPELARRRRLKRLASRLPGRPTLRFLYHYVIRAGFLDGYRGWIFCRLMATYEFLSLSKARELRRRPCA